MPSFYRYRIFCETEQQYVYVILDQNDPVPTKCPNNTSDTVNANTVTIVEILNENSVVVKEETGQTGGTFGVYATNLDISPNSTNTITVSFPYPISSLCTYYSTTSANTKDLLSVTIGENTPIGVITSSASPVSSSWTENNYTIGQMVLYNHPSFGSRIYTCIANTNNNENPTNSGYWKHGFELSVSSTVLKNTSTGYYINLTDNTNNNDLKRVISIDTINSKIYVEGNLSNNFNTGSVILQTVYLMKDYPLGNGGEHFVGSKKIGGTYIPADTFIKVYYTNLSSTETKYFNGGMEYIY
jgi:hypothetical protein